MWKDCGRREMQQTGSSGSSEPGLSQSVQSRLMLLCWTGNTGTHQYGMVCPKKKKHACLLSGVVCFAFLSRNSTTNRGKMEINDYLELMALLWMSRGSSLSLYSFLGVFLFLQDGLWWDWLTGSWSGWASCRRRRGSTSCNRFYSSGCGRKSEPSSFSRKVAISALGPVKGARGVLTPASNQQLLSSWICSSQG